MSAPFAAILAGYTIGEIIIAIIIIAAAVAIMYVALKQMGVAIPPWVIQIFWIVVVCIVAIIAVRIVLSL